MLGRGNARGNRDDEEQEGEGEVYLRMEIPEDVLRAAELKNTSFGCDDGSGGSGGAPAPDPASVAVGSASATVTAIPARASGDIMVPRFRLLTPYGPQSSRSGGERAMGARGRGMGRDEARSEGASRALRPRLGTKRTRAWTVGGSEGKGRQDDQENDDGEENDSVGAGFGPNVETVKTVRLKRLRRLRPRSRDGSGALRADKSKSKNGDLSDIGLGLALSISLSSVSSSWRPISTTESSSGTEAESGSESSASASGKCKEGQDKLGTTISHSSTDRYNDRQEQ